MKACFKENQECCKKMAKCALAVFLTILGVAVALKIITLILAILPGSSYGDAWLVVIAAVIVLFALKYHKKDNCNSNCACPCYDNDNICSDENTKPKSSNKDKQSKV
ncbi:hypothetical protein IB642_04580 [Allofrancisella guangzhouensis]|uniref:hypothetical protein n=1 Tax=Allofrancisella guangzhouensis TaxID=594679 RepID=UPI00068CBDBE|nr:hypothetical protein [Allofrancisella guangzhouensis]MBK2026549.1 hypothetical protein [Allofrancisella guangzhouensis]MBK2044293.1 hypothetical protein [Allofrancisella guangzhouensis]MBK2045536.1 hypothetical protein [Allofrancisella guangzhouensis]